MVHANSCLVGKVLPLYLVTFLTYVRYENPPVFIEYIIIRRANKTMTQNHVSGMETSAVSVLKRAVELDHSGRFQESLVCYQEGIQLLMDVLRGLCLPVSYRDPTVAK